MVESVEVGNDSSIVFDTGNGLCAGRLVNGALVPSTGWALPQFTDWSTGGAIAGDGTNTLLCGGTTTGTGFGCQLVTATGPSTFTPLAANGVYPQLAWNGSHYLLTYEYLLNVYIVVLDATGAVTAGPTQVTTDNGSYLQQVASDGTGWMLVFYDANATGHYEAVSVDAAGTLGTPFLVATAAAGSQPPSISSDGTKYFVTYPDASHVLAATISGSTVTPLGSVYASSVVSHITHSASGEELVTVPGAVLRIDDTTLAVKDPGGDLVPTSGSGPIGLSYFFGAGSPAAGVFDVAQVQNSSGVTAPRMYVSHVTESAGALSIPSNPPEYPLQAWEAQPFQVAFDGNVYLVTYNSYSGGRGYLVDRSGNVLTPAGLDLVPGPPTNDGLMATVIGGNGKFLIAWLDAGDGVATPYRLEVRTLDDAGNFGAASVITAQSAEVYGAWDGTNFLVVYSTYNSASSTRTGINARQVDPTGAVLGPEVVVTSTHALVPHGLAYAPGSSTFFADINDASHGYERGARLTTTGGTINVLDSPLMTLYPTPYTGSGIATDGIDFMIPYNTSLFRVYANGTVAPVINPLNGVTNISWDGSAFVITYGTQIARVLFDGTVVSPAILASKTIAGLASENNGRSMFSWTKFDQGIGGTHVYASFYLVNPLPDGSSCSSNGECTSGMCMSGTCCSSCGGTDAGVSTPDASVPDAGGPDAGGGSPDAGADGGIPGADGGNPETGGKPGGCGCRGGSDSSSGLLLAGLVGFAIPRRRRAA